MSANFKKPNLVFKLSVLFLAFSAVASSAYALPVAGSYVTMLEDWDVPYSMQYNNETYQTFCLEYNVYFTPGNTYYVESVGDYATGGGGGTITEGKGDEVSDDTKWLYAAYMSGVFDGYATAMDVQQAIWYLEGENEGFVDAWNYLSTFSFDASGWHVIAVNIVTMDENGNFVEENQTQLVGSPVPEPTTMILLGTGLIGFGFANRRKPKK
jgi:hypothetical protein